MNPNDIIETMTVTALETAKHIAAATLNCLNSPRQNCKLYESSLRDRGLRAGTVHGWYVFQG